MSSRGRGEVRVGLAVAAIACALVAAVPAGAQVQNGGFEEGLAYWEALGYVWETPDTRSGESAVEMVAGGGVGGQLSQTGVVFEPTVTTLRLWLKAEGDPAPSQFFSVSVAPIAVQQPVDDPAHRVLSSGATQAGRPASYRFLSALPHGVLVHLLLCAPSIGGP